MSNDNSTPSTPNKIVDTDTPTERFDKVIAEARRLAEENPDFVYVKPNADDLDLSFYESSTALSHDENGEPDSLEADCLYVVKPKDGEPQGSCLFGQAIINTGLLTPDQLVCEEGNAGDTVIASTLGRLLDDFESRNTFNTSTSYRQGWVRIAQADQDGGSTWQEAIQDADEHYPSVAEGIDYMPSFDDDEDDSNED